MRFKAFQLENDLTDTGLDELIEAHIARIGAIIDKVETIRTK